MKITIDIEEKLLEIAREKIEGYYYSALVKAKAKALNDMDKISKDIVIAVKKAVKDYKGTK